MAGILAALGSLGVLLRQFKALAKVVTFASNLPADYAKLVDTTAANTTAIEALTAQVTLLLAAETKRAQA